MNQELFKFPLVQPNFVQFLFGQHFLFNWLCWVDVCTQHGPPISPSPGMCCPLYVNDGKGFLDLWQKSSWLLNRQEQSKEQSTWRLEAAIGEASSEGDAGRLMDLCLGHCFFIGFSHPNTFGPDCHLSPHVMSRQYLSHFQACMCRREACSHKGGSCLLVYWFLSSFFLPAAKPAGR